VLVCVRDGVQVIWAWICLALSLWAYGVAIGLLAWKVRRMSDEIDYLADPPPDPPTGSDRDPIQVAIIWGSKDPWIT
jgi:hypothetical protein